MDNRPRYAHRVIWKWLHGTEPPEIDHDNRVQTDNREANLLAATSAANMKNLPMPRHNTSGITGVHWDRARNRWIAAIQVAGRSRHLGRFDDINDAIEAREVALRAHGFSQRHGRSQS
jgi:hypothetical protein